MIAGAGLQGGLAASARCEARAASPLAHHDLQQLDLRAGAAQHLGQWSVAGGGGERVAGIGLAADLPPAFCRAEVRPQSAAGRRAAVPASVVSKPPWRIRQIVDDVEGRTRPGKKPGDRFWRSTAHSLMRIDHESLSWATARVISCARGPRRFGGVAAACSPPPPWPPSSPPPEANRTGEQEGKRGEDEAHRPACRGEDAVTAAAWRTAGTGETGTGENGRRLVELSGIEPLTSSLRAGAPPN